MLRLSDRHFDALSKAIRMECLRHVPQFSGLPLETREEVFEQLVDKATVQNFEHLQHVVRVDTIGKNFYCVLEGRAVASLTLPWGVEEVVREMPVYGRGTLYGGTPNPSPNPNPYPNWRHPIR